MPEFLKLIPPFEALNLFRQNLPKIQIKVETVPTRSALGRVTAAPIISQQPLPPFTRSTVDGYAVIASNTHGASESLPAYLTLVGEVPMGNVPTFHIEANQTAVIHTGGMLPSGANAVVMLEYTQTARPGEVEVLRAVADGENLVFKGEDVAEGEIVIPAGVKIRKPELGGITALGSLEVQVSQSPRIGVLSSGDEVVPPDVTPRPGQVRDINTYTLSALIEEEGAVPVSYGILPDQIDVLREALRLALAENDAVVITAGSSASVRDLTAQVIQEMGEPGVLVHGINFRPGKPTILAVCNGKPVIGLPGNPVSALVVGGIFIPPLIHHLLGIQDEKPEAFVPSVLGVNVPSQAGKEEWIPVHLHRENDQWLADPIFFKSNLIFNLAHADGLIRIPPDANGLNAMEPVQVYLLH